LASPVKLNEKDYANKSWPGKLPKNWESQLTVEFQRTYRPEEKPSPSNISGAISKSVLLPVVPGGEGNPDNDLYEAWASVEVPTTDDLEVFTSADTGLKSLDKQKSVQWTIPFKLKSNVTEQANFTVIFKVHLRNRKTGAWAVTPYDLGRERILVDWPPGTRGQAYLLFGALLPFSFGMIGLSKNPVFAATLGSVLFQPANMMSRQLAAPPPPSVIITPVDKTSAPTGREVNAWLVDSQLPLIINRKYQIGVNIGSHRANTIGGGAFTEPAWGNKTEIELLIAFNSLDADVTPEWTSALLPRDGEMKPVFFDVVPQKPEAINLGLSIYLKEDMSLLEKFRLRLPTVKAAAAGE